MGCTSRGTSVRLLYFEWKRTNEGEYVTSEAGLGEPGVVVAEVSGELDAADNKLDAELQTLLARSESHIVVDLTNVTFIDSSVVRALVVAPAALVGGFVVDAFHAAALHGEIAAVGGEGAAALTAADEAGEEIVGVRLALAFRVAL